MHQLYHLLVTSHIAHLQPTTPIHTQPQADTSNCHLYRRDMWVCCVPASLGQGVSVPRATGASSFYAAWIHTTNKSPSCWGSQVEPTGSPNQAGLINYADGLRCGCQMMVSSCIQLQ